MQEVATSFIADINIWVLCKHLVLGAIYAFILSTVAKRYSRIVGNKSQYVVIFPLLIPTMILIISVIKTSLALSLGLVGALSIVRFRTPIKEPEELSYLFIGISVGLGLGAGQVLATSVCFFFVVGLLILLGKMRKADEPQGIFLDINIDEKAKDLCLKGYTKIFSSKNVPFELRRYEEADESVSATYYIEPESVGLLEEVLEALKHFNTKAKYSVISKVNLLN